MVAGGIGGSNHATGCLMNSNGAWPDCKAEHPPKLVPIGEPVRIETTVGRGYALTEHNFSQCPACGSVWVTIRDSGIGEPPRADLIADMAGRRRSARSGHPPTQAISS